MAFFKIKSIKIIFLIRIEKTKKIIFGFVYLLKLNFRR